MVRVGIDMYTFQVPMAFHGIGIHTFSHMTNLAEHPDVELFYFQPPYANLTQLNFAGQLDRFIFDNELDIFHLPAPMQIPFPRAFLERDWPVRLTATAHDIVPLVFADYYLQDRRVLQDYEEHLEVLQRMDHILAVSEYTRQDLVRIGILPDGITNISAGHDPWFYPLPPELSKPDGLADRLSIEDPFILAFSTIEYRKNAQRTVEGFCRAASQSNSKWQLVFINETTDEIRDILKCISRQFGLEDRIRFTGRVTRADLLRLYNKASALAFPSMYEGFGLPILEAMQCGLPVMVSNTSSMPEVAGNCGIYVDPYDVVSIAEGFHQLFENAVDRPSERGLGRAKAFSWNNVVDRTVEAFRITMAQPKRLFLPVNRRPQVPVESIPVSAGETNAMVHQRRKIRLKPNRFKTIRSKREGKVGSYVSFTLAEIPSDAKIVEATFRVRARTRKKHIRVYELMTGWSARRLRHRMLKTRSSSPKHLHYRRRLKGSTRLFTCKLTKLATKWQRDQLSNHGVFIPKLVRHRPSLILTIEHKIDDSY